MTNVCTTSSDLTACHLPTPLEEFHSLLQNLTQSPRARPSGFEEFKEIVSMEEKENKLNLKHWEQSLPKARGKAEGK